MWLLAQDGVGSAVGRMMVLLISTTIAGAVRGGLVKVFEALECGDSSPLSFASSTTRHLHPFPSTVSPRHNAAVTALWSAATRRRFPFAAVAIRKEPTPWRDVAPGRKKAVTSPRTPKALSFAAVAICGLFITFGW
ncbi:MAG: hypothetical protein FJ276_13285 [Planctomycetes bacterium]|nr:hypothetical protein [Planctomycetota bacterium]